MPTPVRNPLWKLAIERAIGFPDQQGVAGETDYPCPFCHSSHLHINYAKGRALCHGCLRGFKSLKSLLRAVGGKMPDFAIRDNDEDDLVDVIDELGKAAESSADAEQAVHLPAGFTPIAYPTRTSLEKCVSDYLRSRRFTKKDIVDLGIGYCDSGRLDGYAVFPVYVLGKLVTWTSRRVLAFGEKQLHAKDSLTRYALFNYDRCGASERIIITEGPFDAHAVHARVRQSDGGLGLLGTSIPAEKVSAIDDLPAEECILLLDGDDAGRNAARKIAEKLIPTGKKIRMAFPPDGVDPDEMDDEPLAKLVNTAPVVDELDLALEGL